MQTIVHCFFNVIRSLGRIKKKPLLLIPFPDLSESVLHVMHAVLISDADFALQSSMKRETIKTHYLSNYSISAGSQKGREKRGPCTGDQEKQHVIERMSDCLLC